jgi:divalent metal cation (Fe/Co/Zn/Cd) transporter
VEALVDRPDVPSLVVSASPASEQRGAVITALAANVAIAIAKFGAATITGSSAMLAESLHSLADSLTVFWVGGVLAVLEGVSHFAAREPLGDPRWAFAVLGLAAVLEAWSLLTTVRAARSAKGALTWWQLLRATKAPEVIVVFLEDVGALLGICIALIGLILATVTGESAWDAVAAIAIGVLLMAIGLLVNRETQSLLVGESAAVEVVAAIRQAIAATDGVVAVVDLRTIHVGPDDLVIAAGILVDSAQSATGIARAIAEAEARVRRVAPFRTVIYLEPRLRETPPGGHRPDT